jgi:peptidoglycan L-alanyl-D-glutamate endopeptidase CwlK
MTLEEALHGKEIPREIRETLTIVTVPFFSFAEMLGEGQLVVHAELAADVENIFRALLDRRFPIHHMVPIAAYGWSDDVSMAANNTSAFNYRVIAGTDQLSHHATGRAIDVNPVQNPYVGVDGAVSPAGAAYNLGQQGTVTDVVVSVFKSYGWEWGGDWGDRKDWQHFQKPA